MYRCDRIVMKQYLLTLFGVCVVAAIIRAVSFDGVMKKYIEIICALCVISVVISPIALAISSLDSIKNVFDVDVWGESMDYDEIYNEYLVEGNLRASESILSDELCERFDGESGCFEVRLGYEVSDGKISITAATVTLSGEGVATDPQLIEEYIRSRVGVECEIIYDLSDE